MTIVDLRAMKEGGRETASTSHGRLAVSRQSSKFHRNLWGQALFAVAQAAETVDRIEAREGGGFEDVGGESASADLSSGVIELHLHFTLRFLALADCADPVIGQGDLDAGEALDGAVDRVDRAVADARVLDG